MRYPIAVLMLVVMVTMGCRSQAGDPQCVLDGAGDHLRSQNEQNQTQANFQPGVAVSKEGDVQANTTRLGVDVQGAAHKDQGPYVKAGVRALGFDGPATVMLRDPDGNSVMLDQF